MGIALVCLVLAGMTVSANPSRGTGVRLKSDDLTVMLLGDFWGAFSYEDAEDSDAVGEFSCRRALIGLKMLVPSAHIAIYGSLVGKSGGNVQIEDMFVVYRWQRLKRYNLAVILGQAKVPFSFFALSSARTIYFTGRPSALSYFQDRVLLASSRDVGLTLRGEYSNFRVQVGCYNGGGRNSTNSDNKFLTVARFEFAYPSLPKKYVENDLTYYQKLRFTLGVAGAYNAAAFDFNSDNIPDDSKGVTTDAVVRWSSFSFMGGLIYATLENGRAYGTGFAPRYTYGYVLQFGWLLRSYVTVAARYSYYDPNVHYLHDWYHQEALVFNYHFAGLARTLKIEVSRTTTKAAPKTDIKSWGFVVLVQILF